jgi:hypothetical protein
MKGGDAYEYDLELRRIRPTDQTKPFRTEDTTFDAVNPSGTLNEYYHSDESIGGRFWVFVVNKAASEEVVGLLRFRREFDGPAEQVREMPDVPAIYFSRIAVLPNDRGFSLSLVIIKFLLHVTMQEMKKNRINRLLLYWRCQEGKISYFSSALVGSGVMLRYDGGIWGPSALMGILINL